MGTDLPGQLAQLYELSDAWERISLYPSMGAFLSFQYVSPFPTYRPFYRLTYTGYAFIAGAQIDLTNQVVVIDEAHCECFTMTPPPEVLTSS
jgi:hypothetical protein